VVCRKLLMISWRRLHTMWGRHTLDLDDSGPDVLYFAGTELDDVLGWLESFPDHGPRHGRSKLVGRGESRSTALQAVI
jgi:hypothetical protein